MLTKIRDETASAMSFVILSARPCLAHLMWLCFYSWTSVLIRRSMFYSRT